MLAEALAGDSSPVPLRRQEQGVRGSGEAQPLLVSCTAPCAVTFCWQPTELPGPGVWKIRQQVKFEGDKVTQMLTAGS